MISSAPACAPNYAPGRAGAPNTNLYGLLALLVKSCHFAQLLSMPCVSVCGSIVFFTFADSSCRSSFFPSVSKSTAISTRSSQNLCLPLLRLCRDVGMNLLCPLLITRTYDFDSVNCRIKWQAQGCPWLSLFSIVDVFVVRVFVGLYLGIFQLLRGPTNQGGQASWWMSTRQLWIEFMHIMCTTFEFFCSGALAGNWQYITGLPIFCRVVTCSLFGQLKRWCAQLAAFLAKIPMFYLLYCVQSGVLLRCCGSLVSEQIRLLSQLSARRVGTDMACFIISITFSSMMFKISYSRSSSSLWKLQLKFD